MPFLQVVRVRYPRLVTDFPSISEKILVQTLSLSLVSVAWITASRPNFNPQEGYSYLHKSGWKKQSKYNNGWLLLVVQEQIEESLLSESPQEWSVSLKQFLITEFIPFFTIWLRNKGLCLIHLHWQEAKATA